MASTPLTLAETASVFGEMLTFRSLLDKTKDKRERKAMTSLWNKREKQLDRVLGGVTGLYGDLQGIVGSTLPTLDKLELPALEQDNDRPRLAVVGSDVDPANESKDD